MFIFPYDDVAQATISEYKMCLERCNSLRDLYLCMSCIGSIVLRMVYMHCPMFRLCILFPILHSACSWDKFNTLILKVCDSGLSIWENFRLSLSIALIKICLGSILGAVSLS